MRKIRRIVGSVALAGALSIGMVLSTPTKAYADCVDIASEIWQLPPELIVWWFYWTYPSEFVAFMGYYNPEDPNSFVMMLINIMCPVEG